MSHQILLYYLYTPVDDAEALRVAQLELCEELGLKGRIIVAPEGINGTVEGTVEATEKYVKVMHSTSRFAQMAFKRSTGTGAAFPKLSVKARSELVSAHLGEEDVDPSQLTGVHLAPEQLHQWFEEGKELYIVDMRNDYEHAVGYFEGSLLPKLANFRDLPEVLPELEHLKGKTVVTVCTGGVRCEKASGYLMTKGFSDVYQLDGGIVSYMEKYPNEHFLGKLYVFDKRITMGFNTEEAQHQIVGKCYLCGVASDSYVNCTNLNCHRHFISCDECRGESGGAFCSDACRESQMAPVAA